MPEPVYAMTTFQMDGAYANLITGLGDPESDKDEHTRVRYNLSRPNYDSLAAQYAKDGVVTRIAYDPVVKALKNPIVINDDKNDKTFKALSKIGFFDAVTEAGTWTRLYGGALVVEIYEGDASADLSKPAPQGKRIMEYRVYSPGRVLLTEGDLVSDVKSPYYGKVEIFPITLRNGVIIHVHASRCHLFKGPKAPQEMDSDLQNYVFGLSEVERANVAIMKLPGAFGSISNMLQENGLSVFGIKGLAAILAGNEGVQKVRERMSLVKIGMSTMHSVFQDAEDTFEMKSHSMGDVPESVKMIMAYASAVTRIPVSILFGNMVSGLSSTNEGDIRQYEDMVEAWRTSVLYRPMCAMLTSFRNRNEKKKGEQDFTFGDISQPSAAEKADIFDKRVNSCKTLVDAGSMTPKEMRQNLVVNGGTSEISVSDDEVPTGQTAGQ